jgi:RNA polymerase sigma-70 factor, ECF subfamily
MTDKERENWWVLRAQSGDHEALNELLKAVQEPLYRYIFSLVRQQHLAEDILQEVFIRIYRKLRWLQEPRVFRSWAYQIATRETFRHIKRERRWSNRVTEETLIRTNSDLPSSDELTLDLIDRLPELVASLSPASRAVIVLFYLQEMSLDETAAVLSIPLGTAKSRLSYGLESLRRQVRKQKEDLTRRL